MWTIHGIPVSTQHTAALTDTTGRNNQHVFVSQGSLKLSVHSNYLSPKAMSYMKKPSDFYLGLL